MKFICGRTSHLRLKLVWLNLRLKMHDPVLHHRTDALQVFPQHGHFGGALGGVVAILLAQVAGDVAAICVSRSMRSTMMMTVG